MKKTVFTLLLAGLLTGCGSLLSAGEVLILRQPDNPANVPPGETQQRDSVLPLSSSPLSSAAVSFYTCAGTRNGFEFILSGMLPQDYTLEVAALRDKPGVSTADRTVFRIRVEDGGKAYQFRQGEKRPLSLNLKRQTDKQQMKLIFSLNMEQLYQLSGTIPFAAERRERWQIIVRLITREAEYRTWDAVVLCEFPVFHGKDLAKIRSDLFKRAAAAFFDPNAKGVYINSNMPENGEPYAFYLNYVSEWYGNRKLWTENFMMPQHLVFPMHRSWLYYLDSLGGEDPVKQLREEQRKYAQKMAPRVEDPLTGEAAFEEAMVHFTNLKRFWEQLRGQGMRARIYSAGFGTAVGDSAGFGAAVGGGKE